MLSAEVQFEVTVGLQPAAQQQGERDADQAQCAALSMLTGSSCFVCGVRRGIRRT
jgi:hypothetical protein